MRWKTLLAAMAATALTLAALEVGEQSQVPLLDWKRGLGDRAKGGTRAVRGIARVQIYRFLVHDPLVADIFGIEPAARLQRIEHRLLAGHQSSRGKQVQPSSGERKLGAGALVGLDHGRCEIADAR